MSTESVIVTSLKRLLLYWAGATVYCLFTATPFDPDGGVMSIVQSEQMYGSVAGGFYYGAIIMAVQRLFERGKETRERNQKAQEKAEAEAALASPAFTGEGGENAGAAEAAEEDSGEYEDEGEESSEEGAGEENGKSDRAKE